MTREEFIARFRGRMLLQLTEAWAVRKCSTTELGFMLDAHALANKALLLEMYDALCPNPVANGVAPNPKARTP